MPRMPLWVSGVFCALLLFFALSMSFENWAQYHLRRNIDRADAGQVLFEPSQKPRVNVVVLTRYACAPCAAAHYALMGALEKTDDVRVIVQPVPFADPHNQYVARLALAAGLQDKFADFHAALMNYDGALTTDVLRALAGVAGVDFDQLQNQVNDPRVDMALANGAAMMGRMHVKNVPTFIINNDMVFTPRDASPDGHVWVEDFIALFNRAR